MSAGKDRKFKPVPSSMVPVTKCHSVGTMSTLAQRALAMASMLSGSI